MIDQDCSYTAVEDSIGGNDIPGFIKEDLENRSLLKK
jgi:hypothetical protein